MDDKKALMANFLLAMYKYVPAEARIMACQFRGDPNSDIKGKWRSTPIKSVAQLDGGANIYFAVSAMKRNEEGEFRRRKVNFAGGILLMIDDIGDGPGSKFPMSLIDALSPTCLIETSPNNHQAVYMFDSLITDDNLFDRLINGFIAKQFLGKDTGMAGINRVFRPPFGINGKPKYGGWTVKANTWKPKNRYSINAIAAAFGIDLSEQGINRKPHGATIAKADAIQAFVQVRTALRSAGMLKREEADRAGWQDIVCPWTEEHTGAIDNGAAIREPAEENLWVGAFRCHHGGCDGRGWRELTDWLAENDADVLAAINACAGDFELYSRKE
jgi:hypothetical protein